MPFQCSECDQIFTSESNLKTHVESHTKERNHINAERVQSPVQNQNQSKDKTNLGCEKNYELPKPLSSRVSESVGLLSTYTCDICKAKFKTWSECELHRKSHTKENKKSVTRDVIQNGSNKGSDGCRKKDNQKRSNPNFLHYYP